MKRTYDIKPLAFSFGALRVGGAPTLYKQTPNGKQNVTR